MAGTYGRGSAASAGRAQAGASGSAYQYAASSADRYLQADERTALSSATAKAGEADRSGGFKGQRKKQAKKRASAAEQAGRLREVAGTRALEDFNRAGIQHSKPWLQKAEQGLIAATGGPVDADAAYGSPTTGFGSVGVGAARETRGKLAALAGATGAGIDKNLLGGATDRGRAEAQSMFGQKQVLTQAGTARTQLEREIPSRVQSEVSQDFGVTTIADASRAYTGLEGGTRTVYDEDPTTTSSNKAYTNKQLEEAEKRRLRAENDPRYRTQSRR